MRCGIVNGGKWDGALEAFRFFGKLEERLEKGKLGAIKMKMASIVKY